MSRASERVAARLRRGAPESPFDPTVGSAVVVHATHHKAGGVWFAKILHGLADRYGLEFQLCEQPGSVKATSDIVFYWHSRDFDRARLEGRTFRGSHVIRDPRDLVVSAYHYHVWSHEAWLHVPRERFGGQTYHELLNSLSPHDGLLREIRHSTRDIRDMARWDREQPEFIEVRYEDLIADEATWFDRIFRHYGFHDAAVADALDLVVRNSFSRVVGRPVGQEERGHHLRSGRPGEWREHFGPAHRELFNELVGEELIALGYEAGADWADA